jgi:hypothetical protein
MKVIKAIELIDLALSFFGAEWEDYKKKRMIKVQPVYFYEKIAQALVRLNFFERETIRHTLNLHNENNWRLPNSEINFSSRARKEIYEIVSEAIINGNFSQDLVEQAFRKILDSSSVTEEPQEEINENLVIDVTGQEEPIGKSQLERLEKFFEANPSYFNKIPYTYYSQRLGNMYREKLKLNAGEVIHLNKFGNEKKPFLELEGCAQATIRFYLAVLKTLEKKIQESGSSLQKIIDSLCALRCYYPSVNADFYKFISSYRYKKIEIETEIFEYIFKKSENTVRNAYGFPAKLAPQFSSDQAKFSKALQQKLEPTLEAVIEELKSSIAPPDEATEKELNAKIPTRWKKQYKQLEEAFTPENKESFIISVWELDKRNEGNSTIKELFFLAAKFLAAYDKAQALNFYLNYRFLDMKSGKSDEKLLPATIKKKIFEKQEQEQKFKDILHQLAVHQDLALAMQQVCEIFETPAERKKIKLDGAVIRNTFEQDKKAVQLLNKYLEEDALYCSSYSESDVAKPTPIQELDSNAQTLEKAQPSNSYAVGEVIESKNKYNGSKEAIILQPDNGIFKPSLSLSPIQIELLILFQENDLQFSEACMNEFCKAKGVFKGQFIDSLNENCYDLLDDNLIEEVEGIWAINPNYFSKITGK